RPSVEAVPLLLGRETSWAEAQRLAARKQEHYRRLAGGGPALVPGVAAFVTELVARSVPHAVATSASRQDVERLPSHGRLRERFEVVVTAEDVLRGKPDPEVYQLAARRLGVAPEHCLVFEDSLVGVQAARRAGMRAIGVSTAHTESELRAAGAEHTVENFEGGSWPA